MDTKTNGFHIHENCSQLVSSSDPASSPSSRENMFRGRNQMWMKRMPFFDSQDRENNQSNDFVNESMVSDLQESSKPIGQLRQLFRISTSTSATQTSLINDNMKSGTTSCEHSSKAHDSQPSLILPIRKQHNFVSSTRPNLVNRRDTCSSRNSCHNSQDNAHATRPRETYTQRLRQDAATTQSTAATRAAPSKLELEKIHCNWKFRTSILAAIHKRLRNSEYSSKGKTPLQGLRRCWADTYDRFKEVEGEVTDVEGFGYARFLLEELEVRVVELGLQMVDTWWPSIEPETEPRSRSLIVWGKRFAKTVCGSVTGCVVARANPAVNY